MALLSGALGGEVGLQLLLSPTTSSIVIRSACSFVGVAMPVYSTFKAIERKDTAEGESWLVYWSAFGCLSIAEIFSDKLLSWFPYYYHAKLIFLIWLQYPNNYGAKHVYSTILRPFMLAHQTTIDRVVTFIRNELTTFMRKNQEDIHAIGGAIQQAASSGYKAALAAGTRGRTSGRAAGGASTAPPAITLEELPSGVTDNINSLASAAISAAQSILSPSPSQDNVPGAEADPALTNSWIHVQPTNIADVPPAVNSALDGLRQRGNAAAANNAGNNDASNP